MAARASAEAAKSVAKSVTKPVNEQRELETGGQDPVTREKRELHVEERIRQRAYEIYRQRGASDATALDDWLQAETEIIHTVDQNFIDLDKADLAASDK
jgi:Protein of unknown function (DUF2934)